MEFLGSLFFSDCSNEIAIKNYFDQKQEKKNSFFSIGNIYCKTTKERGNNSLVWHLTLQYHAYFAKILSS